MLFIVIACGSINHIIILTGEEQELSVERNEIECETDNLHVIDDNAYLCNNDLKTQKLF